MRLWFVSLFSPLLLAGCLAPQAVEPGPRPEFRGVWVTRFEWTSKDPVECRANISRILHTIADHNFNAAVFQIRGAAEALYPSALEPWSPLLGEADPGFDPLALAIDEAHRNGLEFHAYINPIPLLATRDRTLPSDQRHLYYAHGPDSPDPWVAVDEKGEPYSREYYYLSPGVPEVQAYLRQVILDVVRRYDVDGIHLDRIRYPGQEYSHDPVSLRRFSGRGNPNRNEWAEWQREQLDKFVNDLAAEIRAAKPNVVMSCAAWGIYNRYHLDGYHGFSSGYHDYFQDTWNWCRLGAMDVLMPMIYWDMPDPKPNYDELLDDFARGVGPERVVGGQSVQSPEENVAEIEYSRKINAAGTVLFSMRSAERRGVLARCKETLYRDKAPPPTLERVVQPRFGTILGTVRTENREPLVDAWVSIAPAGPNAPKAAVFARTWTSGSDGRFAFLDVPPGSVVLTVRYPGATTARVGPTPVEAGQTTQLDVTIEGAQAAKEEPFFLTVIAPEDGSETTRDAVHLLGRTAPDCSVRVGDAPADVYSTGAFARDNIPLKTGENRIEVVATAPNGVSVGRSLSVIRKATAPSEPVTQLSVIEPAEDVAFLPGDELIVKLTAPSGLLGHVILQDLSVRFPLVEVLDEHGNRTGTYTAVVRPDRPTSRAPAPVQARLYNEGAWFPLKVESKAKVEVWDPASARVGETRGRRTPITFGTHEVRLGGPFLAEVPAGVRFEIVGRKGPNWKIRLADRLTGWIPKEEIRVLPAGTPPPRNYFTSCQIDGDDERDRIAISLQENVVFAVTPAPEPDNRLFIDFFDTHHAATWISHKTGAQVIGPVGVEQVMDGWTRVTVPLRCKQNWGYWTELDGKTLTLHVRRPPRIADPPASPLAGLRFALEAGHGGRNTGAVGHMGTKEKTVNLAAVDALKSALESRGAEVVLVRPGDSSPTLAERVRRTNQADAHLFVSMHANSAGSARGYLRVSGTSTYYHGDHCRQPAELVYRRLLDLGWNEFGVVGNFSYVPLRNTRTPGILVEQAFMSHPYDEARLLDPEYQRQQAEAIAAGLEEFFNEAREP